jgi:hypothetical protein
MGSQMVSQMVGRMESQMSRPKNYVATHDGDVWIVTTLGGNLTLAELARDKTTQFMCICYLYEVCCQAGDPPRHPTRKTEAMVRAAARQNGFTEAGTHFGVPRAAMEAMIITNMNDKILEIFDPEFVGLDRCARWHHSDSRL